MKATIDGITYEGTVDEIRMIVENPPHRSYSPLPWDPTRTDWPPPQRSWDGRPIITCEASVAEL